MKNNREDIQNNSKTNNEKVMGKSFLLVLLSLIMPTIAGVVIGFNEITDTAVIYFIQFVFITVGCLVTFGIIKKSIFEPQELGFRRGKVGKWIVAVVAIEAIAFTAGVNQEIDLKTIGVLLIFMISVGIFEETIYRGLILQYLMKKNGKRAVFLSALLFGLGHIVNLLGGNDLKMTIVQIIFAMLFGFVCAEIVLLTNSIVMVIIWHSSHNVISNITASPSVKVEFAIVSIQCIILIILGYTFWQSLKKKEII